MRDYDKEKKEIFSHFSQKQSQAFVNYAVDVAFKSSRYIFTRRVGSFQYGYCTHCQKEYLTEGLKHGTSTICTKCNSTCTVKASGKGRKYMVDEVYFVWYEKSVINPDAIVARGIYAVRDYRFDYYKVQTQFETKALYVFEPGKASMIHRSYLYYSSEWGISNLSNWSTTGSVRSETNTSMANKPCFCSHESISKAVKDTPFRFSTWEQYAQGDMVRFFDLYSQYPCIEYLTKMGLRGLVEAKLEDRLTYGAVNWNGQNLMKVLRLSKQDIKEIKDHTTSMGPLALRLYQISKKDKSNLSFAEIHDIRIGYGSYYKDLQKVLKLTTLKKAHAYILKQYGKTGQKIYHAKYHVLHMWRDYIADCVELEMDLKSDSILFPTNLHKAHQDTIAKVKVKASEKLNAQIRKRVKTLEKYSFQAFGFILRPATSATELIAEGNALNHCVGRYAGQHASGETSIFLLRKASEPDKPYFTIEIKGDKIQQTRGLKNCLPPEDVKVFINSFEAAKLNKKQDKSRIQIRQEVAV